MNRCQACGRTAPTRYVEFYQNIGMLVLRSMRSVKGNLCRRCAKRYFSKLTGLTLVTGWWGLISAIINPFVIINNVARYAGCMGLPDTGDNAFPVQPAGTMAAAPPATPAPPSALAAYRDDIAMRLRGGQSPQEIAQFIAPRAGVTPTAVQQYIDALAKNPR